MNDRSEFYARMTGNPHIDAFLRAIQDLERPAPADPAPSPPSEPLLTADEVRRLDFLRYRVERGLVTS